MEFFRTDLAVEAPCVASGDAKGITVDVQHRDGLTVTVVDVTNETGERMVQKPVGRYVTLDIPELSMGDVDIERTAAEAFCGELTAMLGKPGGTDPFLVVGIGNRAVTADSIGPRTAEGIVVTRHLYGELKEFLPDHANSACAIAPGVLGETGLETGEVVRALVKEIRPRAIIAVDSLAAREPKRIAASIQLANTGIAPGSGLKNHRPRLDEGYLGVPVYAVGVPMVVYAASIAYEASAKALKDETVPEGVRERLSHMLHTACGDLVVTPKDVDFIAKNCAGVLALGINMAIHGMSYEEAVEQAAFS
ncbi:MAG: GPR endopeptidase [Clostridiales bacterium]|nr:GPR endopeptidase [Clostridiales bacterium]